MKINNFGELYIVATPIGNLQDISARAIETLSRVACIAAEDTRHSLLLLQHLAIHTPLCAFHEHNEREQTEQLIQRLQNGESIALISDAGTPLLSDPGFFLVRAARKAGVKVIPIPGPCAAITALSAAGLPTDRFVFEGFLPAKSKQRLARLEALCKETRTLIFYEAPHRILDLLEDLLKVFGEERLAVIARELTKRFETIHSARLIELKHILLSHPNETRGEMVVLVQGQTEQEEENKPQSIATDHLLTVLLETLSLKQAVELAAKITGERKNALYQQALRMQAK